VKVLFDTDVVLDFLLDREPFSSVAAGLFARVESGEIVGLLGATTLNAISWVATQAVGIGKARRHIRSLMRLFDVAAVDRRVLWKAQRAHFADFEDSVLHQAALGAGAHAIVTREPDGFRRSELPVLSPEELTLILEAGELLEDAQSSDPRASHRTARVPTQHSSASAGPGPAPDDTSSFRIGSSGLPAKAATGDRSA
jgi:predicted nucleic acid-binding protein